MKIYISSDHAGYNLRREIVKYLQQSNFEVLDLGPYSDGPCNYAEFGKLVGDAVAAAPSGGQLCGGQLLAADTQSLGIAICGTGAGIAMAAGKIKGVRAVCVSEPATARLAREHNNANVITFGARIVGFELAKDIVSAFVNTPFSGEERHIARITTIE